MGFSVNLAEAPESRKRSSYANSIALTKIASAGPTSNTKNLFNPTYSNLIESQFTHKSKKAVGKAILQTIINCFIYSFKIYTKNITLQSWLCCEIKRQNIISEFILNIYAPKAYRYRLFKVNGFDVHRLSSIIPHIRQWPKIILEIMTLILQWGSLILCTPFFVMFPLFFGFWNYKIMGPHCTRLMEFRPLMFSEIWV